MPPITEDIVQRLIERIEARAMRRTGRPLTGISDDNGSMTARLLRFRSPRWSQKDASKESASVLDLRGARRLRGERRTVSGLFFYSARL